MDDIIHNGDPMLDSIPTIKQKALKINLNENIYGTFAEIGAGQETVRQFFRVGGASGTIANLYLHMIKILVMQYMGLKMIKDM
tara:strand:- start:1175 stop:1423 length:249 start_codon:yes stop_codon:yes gene_type:complete